MTIYVLDTGMLLGYVRGAGYADYAERTYALSFPPNIALISVVTVAETLSLAIQFGWGQKQKEKLREIVNKIPAVPITRDIVDMYAEIDTYSQGKNPTIHLPSGITARNMGKNDVWIASLCAVIKGSLLTTDHDFDHLNISFFEVIYIDQSLV